MKRDQSNLELPQPELKPLGARKSKREGAPVRRKEENVPGINYLKKITKLGARERESLISFRKRLAGVMVGRRLWIQTWRHYQGNRGSVCEALKIHKSNMGLEIRRVGLSPALLDDILDMEPLWEETANLEF